MLTNGKYRQCTLHDLQTKYDINDMYDLLEMQEVAIYLDEQARKKAEREANIQNQRGNRR